MAQPPEPHDSDFAELRRKADAFARRVYAKVFERFEKLRKGQAQQEQEPAETDDAEASA